MYVFPNLAITYKWIASTHTQLVVVSKDDLPPRTFTGLSIELSRYLTDLYFSDDSTEVSIFHDGFVYLSTDLESEVFIGGLSLGWDNLLKASIITPKLAQKISVRLKKVKEYVEFATANQAFTVHV